jgi:uncharacterized protein (DUF488 family)
MSKEKIIWTIGHSTRSMTEFIDILQSFDIQAVVDVRSYPGSRKYPQFNKDNLKKILPENQLIYLQIPQLGGRRKPRIDSRNTMWRHDAFRGYADYMETRDFHEGIELLISEALTHRTSIMCAEAVWWRCHRSLISDYLKSTGWKVMHITGKSKQQEHPYSPAARIVNGKLSYTA